LYVVDTRTGDTISKVLLSGRPNLPAVTKDGKTVAVCIREPGPSKPIGSGPLHNYHEDNRARVATKSGAVDFIDTATLTVTTVTTKVSLHDCYATPDGKYIVAGSSEGKFAEVFDVQTKEPAWEIDFDRGVLTMSFEAGPDGSTRRMFVNLDKWRGFAVVDFAKHEEVGRIRFPDPPPDLHSKDPHWVPDDTHGNIISPDGKTLWIGVIGSNQVFAYSLPDLKLRGYVATPMLEEPGNPAAGGVPAWLAITPDGKKIYVALQNAASVSVIDTERLKEVARIPVGKDPKRVATLVLP
jgi:YVTN family beta-propeller protein